METRVFIPFVPMARNWQRALAMLPALLLSFGIAASKTAPNACQVLTPRDVARVQGSKYQRTRLTESSESGVLLSQCLYRLPHVSDSVTVDLIRGQAHEFWQKHFSAIDAANALPLKHEPQLEQRIVMGVGEKAVWSGIGRRGSLYVLSRDTVIRVSVGGGGSEDERIERARRLADRVVHRL
jgi:hypothetical protein